MRSDDDGVSTHIETVTVGVIQRQSASQFVSTYSRTPVYIVRLVSVWCMPLMEMRPPLSLSCSLSFILPPSPPTSLSGPQRGACIRLHHPLRLSLSATFPSACLRREGRHEPPWPRHRGDSWIKYRAELVRDFTPPVNLSVSLSLALSCEFCCSSLLFSTRSLLTAFKLLGWPLWIFHVRRRRGNLTIPPWSHWDAVRNSGSC